MADWCAAAEITLVTDAVGGRQTFYVATHGFSSATSDTPASTAFRELLEDPGGPARSMFSGARVTGPIAIDAGTLKLKNGAGEFDDWPTDYGTAGGTVVVRWGRVGDAYPSAWTLVYRAEIKSLSVDLDYCALGLRNRLYLLDKPVVTDVFAGTGGLEGTGTTSKRKQIAIDEPGYIPLVLLDSVKQLYFVQANASDVRALAGTFPPYYYVFDGGVALTHGGYYTTAADFANGAAPAAGYFKVWAEGWDTTGASAGNAPGPLYVRLGSPPANDLRIATLGYLMNVGDAPTNIRRWKLTDLCNRAGMLDVTPGAMGSRSVNLELGGRLLQGDESYLDVMTDVCKWRHAAVGFTRDDRFFCRELLDPLDTSDPADTVRYVFTEHNAKQFKRTPIPGADAPIWQVSVNAGKTWPCQVANGAPAAVREAMLREPWQTSFTGTSDDVKASNPGAGTAKVDIVGNVFVTKSDKQAFVNRYLMLHGGRRDYLQLRCTQVDADTLALELGDKVQVLHARMGCTPARTFRVVRIEPADLVSREPGIVFGLWGGAAGPAASVLGGGSSSGSPGGSGAPGPTSIGTVSMGEFTGTVRSSVSGVLAAGANVDMGQFIQVCYSSVSAPPDTWDSADQTGTWTLTNADLTAQVTSWPGIASVLGSSGKSSGKRYLEIVWVTGAAYGTLVRHDVGITSTRPVGSGGSGADAGAGYRRGGAVMVNASNVGTVTALSDGDVVGLAVDLGTGDVWLSRNGTWTQGDPAAASSPEGTVATSTTYYPFASAESPAATTVDLRTQASQFGYAIPSGFVAWAS